MLWPWMPWTSGAVSNGPYHAPAVEAFVTIYALANGCYHGLATGSSREWML